MLGTLVKYEFKAVGRIMLPLYGAWALLSILFGFGLNIMEDTGKNLLGGLAGTLYVAVTVAVGLMTIILIVQRFYKNLLGNEGYLMFALPVSTGKHITNKFISSAVWIGLGCIMGCISAILITVITVGPTNVFQGIGMIISRMVEEVGVGITVVTVVEAIIMALAIAGEATMKIYAAIAVGHQWGNHRVLGALGAYIGFGIIELLIGEFLGYLGHVTKIEDKFLNMVYGIQEPFGQVNVWYFTLLLLVVILIAVYWFITWKLLNKRLNLQ